MHHSRLRSYSENWYSPRLSISGIFLLPFSALFRVIVAVRKWCYRYRIFKSYRARVPVIVVGNITVGGTGKTPCVIALAEFLGRHGYRPGIVSRGVGGMRHVLPFVVTSNSSVKEVGDEALMLVRTTNCPMVICADRTAAIDSLLQKYPECNVIISDDGLQHYRMQRDVEIVVVDGKREFGNRRLLPAGPLREPLSRLHDADFVVINNGEMQNTYQMTVLPKEWIALSGSHVQPLDHWSLQTVHAAAAIGHPQRFFHSVREWCNDVIEHDFPDHYQYQDGDLDFADNNPVLMTKKDAVKYEQYADGRHWYLGVDVRLDKKLLENLLLKLQ